MKTNKLKTLKDLERSECHGDNRCYCDGGSVAEVSELKAEAVKWVKNRDKYWYNAWIEFFNLTEDDLKEVQHDRIQPQQ